MDNNDNRSLSERDSIIHNIDRSLVSLKEVMKQIGEAENQKTVRDYIKLGKKAENIKCKIKLLQEELIISCHRIRIRWIEKVDGKERINMGCVMECENFEDLKKHPSVTLGSNLNQSIIPYVFSSKEEGIEVYKQAVQLVPSGDYDTIKRTMMAIVSNRPTVDIGGKQRALKPIIVTR